MKRNLTSIITVVTLFSLAEGPGSLAQGKRSGEEAAIRAADEGWARVFAAKQLDPSVAVCSKNASVLPPNAPIATGEQAIRQLFSGFFALPAFMIEWHPTKVDVAGSGDMGYSSGMYQMSFKDQSGKTISDRGKYITIWKKEAGKWKVAMDIFNSDLAPGSQ